MTLENLFQIQFRLLRRRLGNLVLKGALRLGIFVVIFKATQS